ncbi:MAG: hypothetical protein II942_01240 [Alphaproteobacteria bacterium]|nr:hypothetical protein [Alphaproteobacteria bacterium]
MKKHFLIILLLCCTKLAWAQDLDISLFDDATPNLGRKAAPLDSILLTPPPLPDIRIDLDNSTEKPLPKPEQKETVKLPDIPTEQISLSNKTTTPTKITPVVEEKPAPKPYDVSQFDLADFNLGMSSNEAFTRALQKGFKVSITQEDVPRFYATDYANRCRMRGVIIPADIINCVKDYACTEGTRYIRDAVLKRKNEEIQLFFTSNATGNALYKIIYINKGDNSLNFTQINTARKKLRYKEFWDAMFQKYGYPDSHDNNMLTWGNPTESYMQAYIVGSAYDAYIIMEDVSLSNDDYFEAEDVQEERPPQNRFGF